jgi:hypothetical protein
MGNYGHLKMRGIPERPNSLRVCCFDERQHRRSHETQALVTRKNQREQAKVARAYNKKFKLKEFQVRDLVWEAVLPLGTKDATYGKWSPNWHGPYRIDQVLLENAYMLEELDSVKFPVVVNGQHLKKYFSCMWDDRH